MSEKMHPDADAFVMAEGNMSRSDSASSRLGPA
jgi:hypothetical protein